MSMCIYGRAHVGGWEQKRASGLLKMESQVFVRHLMWILGNELQFSEKALSAFHCWATFSSPDLSILNDALPSTMPRHFQNGKFMYLSHLCLCFSWTSYRNKKSWAEVVRFNLSPSSTYFFIYKCYFQPFYSFLWSLSQLFDEVPSPSDSWHDYLLVCK